MRVVKTFFVFESLENIANGALKACIHRYTAVEIHLHSYFLEFLVEINVLQGLDQSRRDPYEE